MLYNPTLPKDLLCFSGAGCNGWRPQPATNEIGTRSASERMDALRETVTSLTAATSRTLTENAEYAKYVYYVSVYNINKCWLI